MISTLRLPQQRHKKSKHNPELEPVVEEDQDGNDADNEKDEEEAEIEETELFGSLVSQMIEMEEFFRLSMAHDNELTEYLEQAPDDLQQIQKMSKFIQNYLSKYEKDHRTQKMESYVSAFNNILNNNGMTMIKFMQANGKLATFLENKMDLIEEIYMRYLKYFTAKLETELKSLKTRLPEESELSNAKPLTFSQNGNRKRASSFDHTNYNEPASTPSSIPSSMSSSKHA